MNHLKTFWKHYVAGAILIPSAFAAGLDMSSQTTTKQTSLDCKGTDCQIQVLVKYPDFHDAIYYKPNEWDSVTSQELNAAEQNRYDNWKQLIDKASQATSTPIIPPEITQDENP